MILANHKGLLDALVEAMMMMMTTKVHSMVPETGIFYHKVLRKNAEYASAALWNLVFHRNSSTASAADEKMIQFLLELSANDKLISTLSDLLLLKNNCNYSPEEDDDEEVELIKIRRNAISKKQFLQHVFTHSYTFSCLRIFLYIFTWTFLTMFLFNSFGL